MYRHLSRKIVNTHVRSSIPQYLVIIFRRYGELSTISIQEYISRGSSEMAKRWPVKRCADRNAYLIA